MSTMVAKKRSNSFRASLTLPLSLPRNPRRFMAKISPFFEGRTVKLSASFARRSLRRGLGRVGAGRFVIATGAGASRISGDRVASEIPARKADVAAIAAAVAGLHPGELVDVASMAAAVAGSDPGELASGAVPVPCGVRAVASASKFKRSLLVLGRGEVLLLPGPLANRRPDLTSVHEV